MELGFFCHKHKLFLSYNNNNLKTYLYSLATTKKQPKKTSIKVSGLSSQIFYSILYSWFFAIQRQICCLSDNILDLVHEFKDKYLNG